MSEDAIDGSDDRVVALFGLIQFTLQTIQCQLSSVPLSRVPVFLLNLQITGETHSNALRAATSQ